MVELTYYAVLTNTKQPTFSPIKLNQMDLLTHPKLVEALRLTPLHFEGENGHLVFELVHNHPAFKPQIVFMNPELAAKVTPATFDLNSRWTDSGADCIYTHECCPVETLMTWRRAGVKISGLSMWLQHHRELQDPKIYDELVLELDSTYDVLGLITDINRVPPEVIASVSEADLTSAIVNNTRLWPDILKYRHVDLGAVLENASEDTWIYLESKADLSPYKTQFERIYLESEHWAGRDGTISRLHLDELGRRVFPEYYDLSVPCTMFETGRAK